jgi:hypothetical protein
MKTTDLSHHEEETGAFMKKEWACIEYIPPGIG